MPTKLFTIEEAAKEIRIFAETTAKYSQNWDNFQGIAETMLEGAFKAAHAKGRSEILDIVHQSKCADWILLQLRTLKEK